MQPERESWCRLGRLRILQILSVLHWKPPVLLSAAWCIGKHLNIRRITWAFSQQTPPRKQPKPLWKLSVIMPTVKSSANMTRRQSWNGPRTRPMSAPSTKRERQKPPSPAPIPSPAGGRSGTFRRSMQQQSRSDTGYTIPARLRNMPRRPQRKRSLWSHGSAAMRQSIPMCS